MSERWVRKLLRRMKKQGDAVEVHRLRGKASNRKLFAKTQKQALAILSKPDWDDFGPTFAAEHLAKHHQIHVCKETLRGWMIAAGMWQPGSRRIQDVHGWRPRRRGFGELVQRDTSEPDWLEGRGPVRYLVRMIDDATSWSRGRFVECDATPFNMAVLWVYLERLWAASPDATPVKLCQRRNLPHGGNMPQGSVVQFSPGWKVRTGNCPLLPH